MLKANTIAIGNRWDPTNPENILLQVGRHFHLFPDVHLNHVLIKYTLRQWKWADSHFVEEQVAR